MLNKIYSGISRILFFVLLLIITMDSPAQIPGAAADGVTKDTWAIQAVLDSLFTAGGGMIRFTPGTYLTGPLTLKGNNLVVQIDSGATILASPDKKDFYLAGADSNLPTSVKHFITISGFQNLTIQGKGTVNGNGAIWWPLPDNARPRMMQLEKGSHLEVKGITLTNSPMFHLCPNRVYDVNIHDIRIIAPATSPNTDGIDPGICHKVRIYNCYIDNGDDNIAIGASSADAGWGAASSDIIIKHNTFMAGHGVSIGSYTLGGVDSMLVDSCTFTGTDNGVRIKSQRGRGGEVRNITYRNLQMTNVRYPIYLTGYYSGVPPQISDTAYPINSQTPNFHDITVENLTSTNAATNSVAGIIIGVAEIPMTNVKLNNVTISSYKGIQLRNATINITDTMAITVKTGSRIIRELRSQVITDFEDEVMNIPNDLKLYQNYPNPFNPSTTIRYTLAEAGFVSLKVFDVLGNEVAQLVNDEKPVGSYEVKFTADNLASGLYFYTLRIGGFVDTRKMVVVR
jgi:polygalacturonase